MASILNPFRPLKKTRKSRSGVNWQLCVRNDTAWRDLALREGFQEAVRRRDEPWGDYTARKRD